MTVQQLFASFVAIAAMSACGGRQSAPVQPSTPMVAASVPAGAELWIRIVEAIDVTQAIEGKSWAAVVARDVRTPEGGLILAAGSPLYLGVTPANAGLQLIVRSVVARGNSYLSASPVTASGAAVTGLEPWGTAATSADILVSGPKIFVPGQALIAMKLGEAIALR